MDQRYKKLAETLCRHSMKLNSGEHVLFDLSCTPVEMAEALIDTALEMGAYPHVEISDPRISRRLKTAFTQGM